MILPIRLAPLLLIIVSILIVPRAGAASATSFSLRPSEENVTPASPFSVKILVDSGVPLNAYDIVLDYPPDMLEVVNVDNSRSLIDVWTNQSPRGEGGRIDVVGGALTPWEGEAGEILTVNFTTLKSGSAFVSFRKADAYVADGRGTKADSRFADLNFVIAAGPSVTAETAVAEKVPPAVENLEIIEDPVNPNQNLLTFLAKDAESGVKDVQVKTRTGFTWSDWQPATNPYPLPKNVWAAIMRAVDNEGNVTQKVIYNWKALAGGFLPYAGALVGVILVVWLISKALRKKFRAE